MRNFDFGAKTMAPPGYQRQTFVGMIGAWFFQPILHMLRWLGIKTPALNHQANSIKVFVKISDGSENITVPMDLPRDWSVGQVKEHLVSRFLNYCPCKMIKHYFNKFLIHIDHHILSYLVLLFSGLC